MILLKILFQAYLSGKCTRDTSAGAKRLFSASTMQPARAQYRTPAACLVVASLLLMFHVFGAKSFAAAAAPVTIESIQISQDAILPRTYPTITANISMKYEGRLTEPVKINVIAVITRPDHVTKSWQWKNIALSPGETKSISLSKEYDTGLPGVYKIEFAVYSADMRRKHTALSRTFTVSDKSQEAKKADKAAGAAVVAAPEKKKTAPPASAGYNLGIGAYANVANPAGGATILIWPAAYLGVQASYTVGTFTSYEARLLGKMATASGWSPYLGVGYLSVSTTEGVIGVSTTFTDSTVSGVLGVEIPLSKRFYGYVEVVGAGIDLKKIVTNGGQTVEATVEYAPVAIGAGIVYTLF